MPVLVDTSVWVAHFRAGNAVLQDLLLRDEVLMHSHVLLELACGTPPAPRKKTLEYLALLAPVREATLEELLAWIEEKSLYGKGCGMVDVSLLAAAQLTPAATLWTLDKPLAAQAKRLGIAFPTTH